MIKIGEMKRCQLRKDIAEYISCYIKKRIKLNLNEMSPMEYRAHYNIIIKFI
ncbi:IS3 family transposase [Pedobacter nyackensis]|uniref:IS3 family transposase n=1 Tax=Pedobacter nyackensis TaxID=475255 RepID=UPI0039775579